jgi:hypothetical protein
MSGSKEVVMAIYPNAVGFGYAIMENAITPIDCGIKPVKPISNMQIMEKIQKLMERHSVTLVIIQNLSGKHSHKKKRVIELIHGIEIFCVTKGVPIAKYTRGQIKMVFEDFKAKTKYEIAKKITVAIPQYKYMLPRKRKAWHAESYSQGMFDAVSLAITHFYITEERR